VTPTITAVILAYGAETWLEDAVRAALESEGACVDVVLVDNGCTSDAVARVKGLDGLHLITPGTNTGFAGGCIRGAAEATGDYLAFINSDAIVAPDALRRLAAVASEPGVGLAMGSIRLADAPDLMNTAGNPLHFTGMSWAGGFGEPASHHARRHPVMGGSGCCLMTRRKLWKEMGGFAEEYFAYHEDLELSLRTWQRGLSVEYVPDAVVIHHYEFSRNENKFYLIERNRAIMVFTTYGLRTLILLAPMLLLTELLMLAAALAGGWGRAKIRGWWWLWRHRGWLVSRRAAIQGQRRVADAVIFERVTHRLDPANATSPPGIGLLNTIMGTYWNAVRRLL
jgi:GT2 family glycosyltransferase